MRKTLTHLGILVLFMGILALLGVSTNIGISYLLPEGWSSNKYYVPPDWLERTVLITLLLVAFLVQECLSNIRCTADKINKDVSNLRLTILGLERALKDAQHLSKPSPLPPPPARFT